MSKMSAFTTGIEYTDDQIDQIYTNGNQTLTLALGLIKIDINPNDKRALMQKCNNTLQLLLMICSNYNDNLRKIRDLQKLILKLQNVLNEYNNSFLLNKNLNKQILGPFKRIGNKEKKRKGSWYKTLDEEERESRQIEKKEAKHKGQINRRSGKKQRYSTKSHY